MNVFYLLFLSHSTCLSKTVKFPGGRKLITSYKNICFPIDFSLVIMYFNDFM